MVYKLYYFDFTGLGEPIRFLLSYGNIDFEDIRFKFEDWPKYKDSMPTGTVPVLEIDGKKYGQSISICRFLGKKVGLGGSTDFENFEIDNVVDIVTDLREKLGAVFWNQDLPEALKESKLKTLNEETIPFFLGKLEEIAKQNNGHLALKRLTWADLYFASKIEYIKYMVKQNLEKYPNLKKVTDNVYALEGIKKWIAKRPKMD